MSRSRRTPAGPPHTFAGHLNELRRRLMITAGALMVGLLAGWVFQATLSRILMRPLGDKLYYSSPTGGLDFVMSLSIALGVIVALPIAVYQLLKFIEPAGTMRLAKRGVHLIMISAGLALAGASFAYFVSLPSALHFLKSFDDLNVSPLISAKEYLNFALTYIVAFCIIFQLPLIISFIDRIKPIKPSKLFKKQRWVIVASLIIAAFATPTPDPFNQMIMAMPLIILYNVSVIAVALQHSFRKPARKTEPAAIRVHSLEQPPEAVPVQFFQAPSQASVIIETVDRNRQSDRLPNLRHITDPAQLTVHDQATGRTRRVMRDVIMPTPRPGLVQG